MVNGCFVTSKQKGTASVETWTKTSQNDVHIVGISCFLLNQKVNKTRLIWSSWDQKNYVALGHTLIHAKWVLPPVPLATFINGSADGPACTAAFDTWWSSLVNVGISRARPLLRKNGGIWFHVGNEFEIIENVKTFYVDVKHLIFLYEPGLTQLTGSDSIVDKLELDRWWHGYWWPWPKELGRGVPALYVVKFVAQSMFSPASNAFSSRLLRATSICMNSFQKSQNVRLRPLDERLKAWWHGWHSRRWMFPQRFRTLILYSDFCFSSECHSANSKFKLY